MIAFEDIALVLLASGRSRRFQGGDKLLATFRGAPLLTHAAGALAGRVPMARLAVIGADQPERRAMLGDTAWTIVDNPAPDEGQGQSLALGTRAAKKRGARAVMVLLADMPLVPDSHLDALATAMSPELDVVVTRSGKIAGPPALFRVSTFDALDALSGDEGARSVVQAFRSDQVDLDAALAVDVDDRQTLRALNAS